MKVKDIIKKLKTLDENLDVFIPIDGKESEFYIVDNVNVSDVNSYYDKDKEVVIIQH